MKKVSSPPLSLFWPCKDKYFLKKNVLEIIAKNGTPNLPKVFKKIVLAWIATIPIAANILKISTPV